MGGNLNLMDILSVCDKIAKARTVNSSMFQAAYSKFD